MADNVWFATRNWKNRGGDKPSNVSQAEWDGMGSSGFNGFPFPTPTIEQVRKELPNFLGVGPNTFYPIGFEHKELIDFFWKVKTIRCNISANVFFVDEYGGFYFDFAKSAVSFPLTRPSYYVSNFPSDEEFNDFEVMDGFYVELSGWRPDTKEAGLCFSPGFVGGLYLENTWLYGIRMEELPIKKTYVIGKNEIYDIDSLNGMFSYSGDDFGGDPPVDIYSRFMHCSFFVPPTWNFPVCVKHDGLYYPSYSFNCNMDMDGEGIYFAGMKESGSPVFHISFLGKSFPIYTTGYFLGLDYTFAASLEVVDYFSYSTKSGLPVWDTETGEQLNDPTS